MREMALAADWGQSRQELVPPAGMETRPACIGRARKCLMAGAVTCAIFAMAPALASAAIVAGRGIAGVKLGDTSARVVAVLGKPTSVQKHPGGEENWLWSTGPIDWVTIRAKGAQKRVEGIETSDPRQRTSRGIGVGSLLPALRRAYSSLTCKRGWLGLSFSSCWILTRIDGRRIPTNFVVINEVGTISAVDVGLIGERNLAPQLWPMSSVHSPFASALNGNGNLLG